MSFAFLPLYTGDYLRDTRHLTPQKHGVYLLLLMHCWDQKGPLPLEEQECAGIANCRSADEIDSLRYILKRYFIRMDDGWYQNRMQHEIERANVISSSRSEAGRLGYQAKAKQMLNKSKAKAKQVPLPPPPPLQSTTTPTKGEALGSSPLGVSPSDVVITVPLNDGTEFPISKSYVLELERLYPDVDCEQTLREIRGWSLANDKRRKTKSGILRHVNSWFARVQNA